MRKLRLADIATPENFDEQGYLAANPDVRAAVLRGDFRSGRTHFERHGRRERRPLRRSGAIEPIRAEKMAKLEPRLEFTMQHERRGLKYDFLTDALRAEAGIAATENVSANSYDPTVLGLIERHAEGLVLDCGAGRRDIYFSNVVNYEIVDYDTTDVLGVGEALPFKDASFDAVISIAVLEHVRDPFRCAAEIERVLKPGGELAACVPFLQPLHGYPHHYFNASPQGLRRLFENLDVIAHTVPLSTHPVWSLVWIVRRWADSLPPAQRATFLDLRLADLLASELELVVKDWSMSLPPAAQMELASATFLHARKRG